MQAKKTVVPVIGGKNTMPKIAKVRLKRKPKAACRQIVWPEVWVV
jgi:hypothetical protein